MHHSVKLCIIYFIYAQTHVQCCVKTCLPLPIRGVSGEGDRRETRVEFAVFLQPTWESLSAHPAFMVGTQMPPIVSLSSSRCHCLTLLMRQRGVAGGTETSRGSSGTCNRRRPAGKTSHGDVLQGSELMVQFSFIGISLIIIERKRRRDGSRESCARPACVWNAQTWLGGTDGGTQNQHPRFVVVWLTVASSSIGNRTGMIASHSASSLNPWPSTKCIHFAELGANHQTETRHSKIMRVSSLPLLSTQYALFPRSGGKTALPDAFSLSLPLCTLTRDNRGALGGPPWPHP